MSSALDKSFKIVVSEMMAGGRLAPHEAEWFYLSSALPSVFLPAGLFSRGP